MNIKIADIEFVNCTKCDDTGKIKIALVQFGGDKIYEVFCSCVEGEKLKEIYEKEYFKKREKAYNLELTKK